MTSAPPLERSEILLALDAACWVVEGAGGAALLLNIHPHTLRYRMRALGIVRPVCAVAPVERHPPAAGLTVALAKLRREVRLIQANNPPGPGRAMALRGNELEQRAVLAKLREALGERPMVGGVRF